VTVADPPTGPVAAMLLVFVVGAVLMQDSRKSEYDSLCCFEFNWR
jgi:hypothetical protein